MKSFLKVMLGDGYAADKMLPEARRRYFSTNAKARDAFLSRREAGLDLSDRVWRYTNAFKDEIETALDVGLRSGLPAARLATELKQYLQHPDKLFRRVRDRYGNLRLSRAAAAYHPGRGVYRSYYKNARRLAVTETNMAYRTADHLRWQKMDFIVGIKIEPSGTNHPEPDICDDLAGTYPKDFKWTGWHPHCRCHALTILKTDEEIAADTRRLLAGDAPTPAEGSDNAVAKLPQNFTEWMEKNADRIEAARKRGTLPYFIKDNFSIGEGGKLKRGMTLLERAEVRHAERSAEQIEAIKMAWARRIKRNKAIRINAEGIAKLAADYGEAPSLTALRKAITGGDLNAMQAETRNIGKALATIRKQEAALGDLIPDAHKWHRDFTLSELQRVHKAVESKLAEWVNLPLEKQKKKLEFEAYEFLGKNMGGVQQRYKTWQVSQAAYIKKLAEVEDAIDWKQIKASLSEAQSFITKSKLYKGLVGKLENAVGNHDKHAAKNAIAEIQAKRAALQQAASRRATKRGEVTFGPDAYSKARKDAALWSNRKDRYGLYDRKAGDDYFRPFAEKDWARWTENEKDVAYLYTSGSYYINEPLYTIYHSIKEGLHGEIRDSWRDINTLTEMIDKSSPFTRDVWLNRGASEGEFKGQFGLDLANYIGNEGKLVGVQGEQKAFLSTAHSKSWGFVDDGEEATSSVVYNIYCPKGTKGIYVEPYSAYGNGGRYWDGKKKHRLKNELEVILQRGAKLRVTKAEYKDGIWFIDLDLIGQPPKYPGQP